MHMKMVFKIKLKKQKTYIGKVIQKKSIEKVFRKISKYSLENICDGVHFNKTRLHHKSFPMNSMNFFFKKAFPQNNSGWMLLKIWNLFPVTIQERPSSWRLSGEWCRSSWIWYLITDTRSSRKISVRSQRKRHWNNIKTIFETLIH